MIITIESCSGENYFKGSGLEQVLSGEKQTFLQDKVSAINTSRTMLRDDNSSLEEKVAHIHPPTHTLV